ncbi:MAG: hypothetical protein HY286_15015 [Planctomycetes bacterium]|nr:hypothetical protein [Planctomycetota bacterium]
MPFPRPGARIPDADIAVIYTNDRARLFIKSAGGIVESETAAGAADIRAAIDAARPRSRRTLFIYGYQDLYTRAMPAPPGLNHGYANWARSITSHAFEERPAHAGVWVFGDHDKHLALAFAAERQYFDSRLEQLLSAKLNVVACVPSFILGANAAFAALESRTTHEALVIDLLDPSSVAFTAISSGRVLVARVLPRPAASTHGPLLEEARRTISYVRERNRGLALTEVFLCSDRPELGAALESDGLLPIPGAPPTLADAVFVSIAPNLSRAKGNILDLLPASARNRPARRGAWITVGMAACVAIFSIAQTAAETTAFASAMEASETALLPPGEFENLAANLAELKHRRERAKSLQTMLENAHASSTARCLEHLKSILEQKPNSLQLSEFESDGDNVHLSGFALTRRDRTDSPIETFAIETARRAGAEYPKISINSAVEPGIAKDLESLYPPELWAPEAFTVRFHFGKN